MMYDRIYLTCKLTFYIMEGKAMKKKIILFLSFLLIAMFLTGCSEKTIQGTTIEEMTEIANYVINQKGDELPDGYKVSYPDGKTNARIEIIYYLDKPIYIDAIFDVSGKEVKLVEISIVSFIVALIFCVIFAIIAFFAVLDFICFILKKAVKK